MNSILNVLIVTLITSLPWEPPHINEPSALSIGIGGSPTALNNDVAFISWNPASIASIDRFTIYNEVMGAWTRVFAHVKYDWVPNYEPYREFDHKFDGFINFIGIAFPLNEKYSAGFYFSTPYNRRVTYMGDRLRRFRGWNGVIGCKINKNLSLGMNISILVDHTQFTRYIEPQPNEDETPSDTTIIRYVGSDQYGIEPSFGLQYKVNERYTLGAFIRKGVVWGEARFQYNDDSLYYYNSREILPFLASFGIKAQISPKLTLNISTDYIGWIGPLGVEYILDGESQNVEDKLRNVIRFHTGLEYEFNSIFTYRLGFYSNPSEQPFYGSFDSSLPTNDQYYITFGASIKLGNYRLDLGGSNSLLPRALFLNKKLQNDYIESNLSISLSYPY